jgi:tellurite resistance protein TehA-like permease
MIGVAPIGVSIIALNTILPVMQKCGLGAPEMNVLFLLVKILSILLWGFGMWWMLLAAALIATYFLKGGIPVTLGYWAFIFPPAAYTIATLILAKSLGLPFLHNVAVVLTALLVTAWIIVFALTLKGALNRTIFDVSPTFKGDIPYL